MIKTRTAAQRYNKRLDAIWEQARANGTIQSDNRWNTEFWCNGELQVQRQLTAEQVQAITKIIEETK